VLALSKKIS